MAQKQLSNAQKEEDVLKATAQTTRKSMERFEALTNRFVNLVVQARQINLKEEINWHQNSIQDGLKKAKELSTEWHEVNDDLNKISDDTSTTSRFRRQVRAGGLTGLLTTATLLQKQDKIVEQLNTNINQIKERSDKIAEAKTNAANEREMVELCKNVMPKFFSDMGRLLENVDNGLKNIELATKDKSIDKDKEVRTVQQNLQEIAQNLQYIDENRYGLLVSLVGKPGLPFKLMDFASDVLKNMENIEPPMAYTIISGDEKAPIIQEMRSVAKEIKNEFDLMSKSLERTGTIALANTHQYEPGSEIDAESKKTAEEIFSQDKINASNTSKSQVAKCLSLYKNSPAYASVYEAVGMTAGTTKDESSVTEVALRLSAPAVVSSIKGCASKFKEEKKVNWEDVTSASETTAYKTTAVLVQIALTKNEKAVTDAAKQISKAKTPEEAVRIANELAK